MRSTRGIWIQQLKMAMDAAYSPGDATGEKTIRWRETTRRVVQIAFAKAGYPIAG